MVNRIQNRNTGYSDNLFSHNTRVDSNAITSIDGATALKLDESYEIKEEQNAVINNFENRKDDQQSENTQPEAEQINEIPSGISMESASYVENNIDKEESFNNVSSTSLGSCFRSLIF